MISGDFLDGGRMSTVRAKNFSRPFDRFDLYGQGDVMTPTKICREAHTDIHRRLDLQRAQVMS